MKSSLILINLMRWIVLLFVQVFLLRNIGFYNLSAGFIYILFILVLPFNLPNIVLYIFSFITGLTIDAFYDTLGVHTSACVALAFVRTMFISVSLNREAVDEAEPSLGNMGFRWFALYAIICIFTHHVVVFFLEAFKFSEFSYTLSRVFLSTGLSLFIILLTEFIFHNRKSS